MSKQKDKINVRQYFQFSLVIILLLINACAQKTKHSKEIETVRKALEFLKNQDSSSFYSLIDTSLVIDVKGREGLSNEVKNASFFLRKFGLPRISKYLVIDYEMTDIKSADIIVPIVQNDTSHIKVVKIVFEFARHLPQTKALNFYLEIQSTPQIQVIPPPK